MYTLIFAHPNHPASLYPSFPITSFLAQWSSFFPFPHRLPPQPTPSSSHSAFPPPPAPSLSHPAALKPLLFTLLTPPGTFPLCTRSYVKLEHPGTHPLAWCPLLLPCYPSSLPWNTYCTCLSFSASLGNRRLDKSPSFTIMRTRG